jgi:UDP-glucose 4-epimerase
MSKKDYILLTGGAGYIGSSISYYLLCDNKNVIIVDNFSNCHENNLKSLPNRKNLLVFNIDCCDYISMESIFKTHSISVIIHLAGLKAVSESIQLPMKYYEINLLSSINILKLMSLYSVKKFIFSSSATVYGNQLSPLSEETQTGIGITNPYGMTKYMIECMIKDFAKVHLSIDFVILRYFNPVGTVQHGLIIENPKDTPNNLMPVIVRNYLQNTTIQIFGNDYNTYDGTPARDYIHIEDLAKGHIKAIEYHNNHDNISIFNLGTGKSYTVLDVIKKFELVNNVKLNYIFSERRSGDLEDVYCNPEKSNKELNWKAQYGLDEMCDFRHLK